MKVVEKFKELLPKLKKGKLLVILGIAGILLIAVSSLIPAGSKAQKTTSEEFNMAEYTKSIEKNVKKMVTSITGNRDVTVVITFESGIKYTYADAEKSTVQNKTYEAGSDSGSDVEHRYTILTDNEGNESALLTAAHLPEVRGVAVAYGGAYSAAVTESISKALQAGLGITSKRIYITCKGGY